MDRQARRLVNKREKDDRHEKPLNFNNLPWGKLSMKGEQKAGMNRGMD